MLMVQKNKPSDGLHQQISAQPNTPIYETDFGLVKQMITRSNLTDPNL